MSAGKITRFQNNVRIDGDLDLSNSTGNLTLSPLSSAPSSPTVGDLYYDSTLGKARIYQAAGWSGMDGTAAGSLDAAYNGGSTITCDTAAVTINDSIVDAGGLVITSSGVVTGSSNVNVLYVNSTGAHDTSGRVSLLNLNMGSEAATTPEGARITMQAETDNAIKIVKGSITIDDGGLTASSVGASTTSGWTVTTANTSGDGFTFNIDSLTSGDGFIIDGDATAGGVNYFCVQEGSANIFTITDDDVYSTKPVEIDVDDADAFLVTEAGDTEVFSIDTTNDAADTTFSLTGSTTSGKTVNITGANDTGNVVEINADAVSTGNALLISVKSDVMGATGAAISVIDNANADREVFAVRDDGTVYMYGTGEGTTVTQAVTGDVVITDGDLTLSGGEVSVTDGVTTAGSGIALISSMTTAGAAAGAAGALTITADSATTGTILAISAEAITTGDMLYLDAGGATMTAGSGFFINCNDDNTSYFTVSKGGATTIAIPAANSTDALTITQADSTNAKDVIVTSNADTGYDLKMTSTDPGAQGVNWYTNHNSASEADNDVVFMLTMNGNNDKTAAETIAYATIKTAAYDVSDGSEDGELQLHATIATTSTEMMTLNDAGGGDITMYVPLEVASTTLTVGPTPGTVDAELVVTATTGVTVLTTDGSGASFEIDTDTNGAGNIILDSGGDIVLEAAGADITMDAQLTITNTSADQLVIAYDGSNTFGIDVDDDGSTTLTTTGTDADFEIASGTGGDITLDATAAIVLESTGVTSNAEVVITQAAGSQLELVASGVIKCVDSVTDTTGVTTRTISGGSTNSYEIVADVIILDSAAALTLESTGVTSDAKITITQASAATAALAIDCNGDAGDAVATAAALHIENTGNAGIGLGIYTNHAGSAGSGPFELHVDNNAFDKEAMVVTNDGVGAALAIANTYATSTADVLTIANASTANAIAVDQNAAVGTAVATDGAVHIENTGGSGIGLGVYSNQATSLAELVSFSAANASFDNSVLVINQGGTADAVAITNAGASNAVEIDQNGDSGATVATDGALHIENTGNAGIGLGVYSNQATSTAELVSISAANSSFDNSVLVIASSATAATADMVTITNASVSNALTITQNGDTGPAAASDGAVFINNTANNGIGLNVYSDEDAAADGVLVQFTATNAGFDQYVLSLDNDGTGDCMYIDNAGASNALEINQDGASGNAVATDGALHIENTGNSGIGLGVYTNHAGTAGAALVAISSANALFDQAVMTIDATTSGAVSNILVSAASAFAADKAVLEIVSNVTTCDTDSSVVRLEQTHTAGQAHVITLKQDDLDQGFINFEGTATADESSPISTHGTGTITDFVRCSINGTDAWIPVVTGALSA